MTLFLTSELNTFEALCAAVDDGRGHPEQDQLAQLGSNLINEVISTFAETAMDDHLATIVEGILGGIHSARLRLSREHDRAADELRQLHRENRGDEITDVKMQEVLHQARSLDAIVQAVTLMVDGGNETYEVETGNKWQPWKGSIARTASTIAQIDAGDALRAKRAKELNAVDPGDYVVVFRAAPFANDPIDASRIFDYLNRALAAWPSMKLATTGAPGAEQQAISWAKQKRVDVILQKPNFNKYNSAAPFRANDTLLKLQPVMTLTLDNSLNPISAQERPFGPAQAIGREAETLGLRHERVKARA
jgi:hypothetical protein